MVQHPCLYTRQKPVVDRDYERSYTGWEAGFSPVTQLIREQPTKPLGLKVPPSLIRDLDEASLRIGANRSRLIRTFIERGLESLPKQRR